MDDNSEVVYNLGVTNEKALGLLLKMATIQARENLKVFLISKNIFPAILWPGQIESRDIETEEAVLFLHLDYRYDFEDIKYITNILNQYFIK